MDNLYNFFSDVKIQDLKVSLELKILYNILQGVFFDWSRPKSMEQVPPNKGIDWFRHKSFKYGTGPTQEKKMTGSAQHIENG